MPKDEHLYDIRVIDRHLKEGSLSKKDVSNFLKTLPDVTEKSEVLIIDEEETTEDVITEEIEETQDSEEKSSDEPEQDD